MKNDTRLLFYYFHSYYNLFVLVLDFSRSFDKPKIGKTGVKKNNAHTEEKEK